MPQTSENDANIAICNTEIVMARKSFPKLNEYLGVFNSFI